MAEDRHTSYLTKWLQNELTDEEFGKVASPEEITKYRQILGEVDRWVPDEDTVIFDPVIVTSRPKTKESKVIRLNSWIAWSAAASVLVAIVSVLLLYPMRKIRHLAETGQIKEVILPDGASKVTLSSGSSVSWTKADWTETKREITISGKAYLEVAKGAKFRAKTKSGIVEVLGTRFEVSGYEDFFQLQCFEGKVMGIIDDQEVIATGGIGFRYYAGAWEEIEVQSETPDWLQNQSTFRNAPLTEVLKSLEASYGLTIQTGNVSMDRRFTGSFPNNDLALTLRIVFDPFGISYKLDGVILQLNE